MARAGGQILIRRLMEKVLRLYKSICKMMIFSSISFRGHQCGNHVRVTNVKIDLSKINYLHIHKTKLNSDHLGRSTCHDNLFFHLLIKANSIKCPLVPPKSTRMPPIANQS